MTDTLERLWAEIPTGSAPLPALVDGGGRMRRRRRTAVSIAATAAVLAVVGGTAVLGQGEENATREVASEPVPPEGTRYVGVGRVVVAVPEGWRVGGSEGCLASGPGADGRPFDARLDTQGPDCSRVGEPWVRVLDVDDPTLFLERDREIDLGGVPGTVSLQGCSGFCPRPFENTVLRVPSEGALLQISGAPVLRGPISASAKLLPEGWTTVPDGSTDLYSEAVEELEGAGFIVVHERVVHDCPDTASCVAGSWRHTVDPPTGTVVAEGSTITLTAHIMGY